MGETILRKPNMTIATVSFKIDSHQLDFIRKAAKRENMTLAAYFREAALGAASSNGDSIDNDKIKIGRPKKRT